MKEYLGKPGKIYLMRCETHDWIKIGRSADPTARARSLSYGEHAAVKLIAEREVSDDCVAETVAHRLAAWLGYERDGEWFDMPMDAAQELLALVADFTWLRPGYHWERNRVYWVETAIVRKLAKQIDDAAVRAERRA